MGSLSEITSSNSFQVLPSNFIHLFDGVGKAILEDTWPSIVRWLKKHPIAAPQYVEARAIERMH